MPLTPSAEVPPDTVLYEPPGVASKTTFESCTASTAVPFTMTLLKSVT